MDVPSVPGSVLAPITVINLFDSQGLEAKNYRRNMEKASVISTLASACRKSLLEGRLFHIYEVK